MRAAPRQISVLEQLAYVGKRGIGALEYEPAKDVRGAATTNIDEMADIVAAVLQNKLAAGGGKFDNAALLNIFRIGTSAGGVRPKILVSEHKTSGQLVAGDLVFSNDYEHYLVELHVQDGQLYNREII